MGKEISVAFMCSNIDPSAGGSERVTRYVAGSLKNKGYSCYYIYSNIDDMNVPNDMKVKVNLNGSANELFAILIDFIKCHHLDVLIVVNQVYQTPKFQKVYKKLKEETKIKIVGCLHAAPDNWKKNDKRSLVLPIVYLKSRIKRYLCFLHNSYSQKSVGMYYLSDKFLLLSDRYIPTFCKTFHVDDSLARKLIAIPNPCPFTDSYQGEKRDKIVLIVARMDEIQKRIYFALKVWKKIFEKTKGWSLVIVGDGRQLKDYKKYTEKNRLTNVRFEGHSSNVAHYYKTSKVFFMTSIWEGQPMSVIEAMHFGCVPIAVDSFESLHDLVKDGENGVLCKFNDFEDVCKKLTYLLSHEEKIDLYSHRILNTTNEMFVEENIIRKWENLLTLLTCESK